MVSSSELPSIHHKSRYQVKSCHPAPGGLSLCSVIISLYSSPMAQRFHDYNRSHGFVFIPHTWQGRGPERMDLTLESCLIPKARDSQSCYPGVEPHDLFWPTEWARWRVPIQPPSISLPLGAPTESSSPGIATKRLNVLDAAASGPKIFHEPRLQSFP